MSNYTPIVNYAPKDALPTGDPAKKIKGVEIAAEYTSISSMSTTKEDLTNKNIANGYCGLNSSALVDDVRLTTNIPRFNGVDWTYTGGILIVSNATPRFRLFESGAAVNNRYVEIIQSAEVFGIRFLNDAGAPGSNFLTVNRTGSVVDDLTITANAIGLTGPITLTGLVTTTGNIELGHATDTTFSRVSAGVAAIEGSNILTNATGKRQGRTTIPIMAAAMIAAATNGPAVGSPVATTNLQNYKTLDFDQTTQEFAHFQIPFPKSWNLGTVAFQPIWTAIAGVGAVVWQLEAVAVGDDDAIDVAWGTAQSSTDTLIVTGDIHVGPESSAITVAGTPVNGDLVFFRIRRAPADVGDTLTADARLIGIRVFYTENAADDT